MLSSLFVFICLLCPPVLSVAVFHGLVGMSLKKSLISYPVFIVFDSLLTTLVSRLLIVNFSMMFPQSMSFRAFASMLGIAAGAALVTAFVGAVLYKNISMKISVTKANTNVQEDKDEKTEKD